MIDRDELIRIGRINKPHGIKGELSMTVDDEAVDPEGLRCLIIDREGLPVPFFMTGVRPRSGLTYLVSLDGVADDEAARGFVNAEVFALRADVEPMLGEADDDGDNGEGFYANDLIGMSVEADGRQLGEITAIDDTTANLLMVVTPPDGSDGILIPVAAEFFDDIDMERRHIVMTLPEGLLDP